MGFGLPHLTYIRINDDDEIYIFLSYYKKRNAVPLLVALFFLDMVMPLTLFRYASVAQAPSTRIQVCD